MATMTTSAQTDPSVRLVTLFATLRAGDPSSLLRLATALHRRNADIVNASLQSVADGSANFVVTVRATESQARTLALTLAGVIGVLETGACEVSAG